MNAPVPMIPGQMRYFFFGSSETGQCCMRPFSGHCQVPCTTTARGLLCVLTGVFSHYLYGRPYLISLALSRLISSLAVIDSSDPGPPGPNAQIGGYSSARTDSSVISDAILPWIVNPRNRNTGRSAQPAQPGRSKCATNSINASGTNVTFPAYHAKGLFLLPALQTIAFTHQFTFSEYDSSSASVRDFIVQRKRHDYPIRPNSCN